MSEAGTGREGDLSSRRGSQGHGRLGRSMLRGNGQHACNGQCNRLIPQSTPGHCMCVEESLERTNSGRQTGGQYSQLPVAEQQGAAVSGPVPVHITCTGRGAARHCSPGCARSTQGRQADGTEITCQSPPGWRGQSARACCGRSRRPGPGASLGSCWASARSSWASTLQAAPGTVLVNSRYRICCA